MLRLVVLVTLAAVTPLTAAGKYIYSVELAAPETARAKALVSVVIEIPNDEILPNLNPTLTEVDGGKINPTIELSELPPSGSARAVPEGGKSRLIRAVFVAENMEIGKKRAYRLQIDPTPRRKSASAETFSFTERNAEGLSDVNFTSGDTTRLIARMVQPKFDDSSKENRLASYKPFVHLFDPETGTVMLTNGAEGKYPHHRGVFYGFNKISYGKKAADCWHCTGDAHQAWRKMTVKAQGPLFAMLQSEIDWCGPGKEAFAHEQRAQSFYHLTGGTLMEFTSVLTPLIDDPVRLDGDPQHAGFHYRAAQEVEAKTSKETYFLKATGKEDNGKEENWDPKTKQGPTNLPWEVMSFVVNGKRYSLLYIDSPNNPKESRHSERSYGRIGNYFEYTATKEKPLEVHYRLWLQAGEITKEQCEALVLDFVQPIKATAKPILE